MFNESLRKVNEQAPPTIIEEDESPRRANRPPDLQGFSILDEKWRGSSSEDSDDSLPAGSYISTTPTPGRFCKSVDFRPLRRSEPVENSCATLPNTPISKNPPLPVGMSSGGSRFKSEKEVLISDREMSTKTQPSLKVVPVETRYKRDRWTCVDYYDSLRDPYFSPNSKHAIAKPAAVIKKEEVVNRSSRSLSDIHPSSSPSITQLPQPIQQKIVPPTVNSNPRPVYTVPKVAPTAQVKASTVIQPTVNGQIKVSSETQISTNGNGKVAETTEARRTKSVAASPPGKDAHNIDNKIEQAMDLVKTHLMFAVREEVDGLRSKIFDLENHVRRLEAENAILKRTIPNDTLKQLHLKL